jgi:hypothetical protein
MKTKVKKVNTDLPKEAIKKFMEDLYKKHGKVLSKFAHE